LISRDQYGRVTSVPFNFVTYTSCDFAITGNLDLQSQTTANARATEAERRATLKRLNLAMNAVDDLERKIGITERWMPEHLEFKSAIAYINNRQFIRCVETLEGLIVQRLFELSKANLAGTGKSFYILRSDSNYSAARL
jgi:hypothetical protein